MNHRLAALTSNAIRLEVGCASREDVNRKTVRDQLSRLPRHQGFYNLKLATFVGATGARKDRRTKPLCSPSHGVPDTPYAQLAEVILTDGTSPSGFDAEVDATAVSKKSGYLLAVCATAELRRIAAAPDQPARQPVGGASSLSHEGPFFNECTPQRKGNSADHHHEKSPRSPFLLEALSMR